MDKEELGQRQMNELRGGANCTCGCHYEYSGGSSNATNNNANYKNSYTSYGGGHGFCAPCWLDLAKENAFWGVSLNCIFPGKERE
ncbi:TIGR04149 family rSAM-modified RiPP [Parabacteroides pacaensis]|uniref:TIGR04149 family rSAM-modified RiPP n=1 Tax=Parabacteroides pacaensis TaxID=2086575 RepID=UPI0029370656|nr:TIGR04149 family rSAM-modified RiPP [Parabacteroides pacaensis]